LPRASKPFYEKDPGLPTNAAKTRSIYSVFLTVVAFAACGFAIVHLVLRSNFDVTQYITPALELPSWMAVIVFTIIRQPTTAPISLLFFYIAIAILHIAFFTTAHLTKQDTVYHSVQLATALISCATVLIMPFRYNPTGELEISQVGTTPSHQHRSPEDEIRLYQFLTVTWVSPLIKIGNQRKLEEADIWSLPSEFQHRQLFEKFQQVAGGVVMRCVKANAFDLFLISLFALVDLVTGMLI
jgi:hypothetical protein